jgi:hypothetical protein
MVSKPFTLLTALLFTLGTLHTSFAIPNLHDTDNVLLRRQQVEGSGASQAGVGSGQGVNPPPPPGPPNFTGTKLVNDRDHPWRPLRNGDIRGPCPGLNTLASHGVSSVPIYFQESLTTSFIQYLPRDGVASPSQIVTAVQEGTYLDDSMQAWYGL